MRTLLFIWSLALGQCLAGPFFFGQQGAAAGTPSGSWSPTDLGTNLWQWVDASQESLSGAAVSTFTDRSGNGRNYTQATVSKRPIGNTSPSRLTFDGVDDFMAGSTLSIPRVCAIVVAIKPATAPAGIILEGGISNPWYLYAGDSAYRSGSAGVIVMVSSTWLGTSAATATAWTDGSTLYVRKNGSAVGSNSGSSSGSATDVLAIMSRQGTSLFSGGDLYELLIFTNPTLSSVQQAENYLKTKWGTP